MGKSCKKIGNSWTWKIMGKSCKKMGNSWKKLENHGKNWKIMEKIGKSWKNHAKSYMEV
jgi:hypothetical protein